MMTKKGSKLGKRFVSVDEAHRRVHDER